MRTNFSKDRIRDLAIESALIVFSILFAFSLNAWWATQQEQREVRSMLEKLHGEFELNSDRLAFRKASHVKTRNATSTLLSLAGPQAALSLGEDSVRILIWESSSAWSFDAADGILNSILSSGRIGLIQNDGLRSALASWPSVVGDIREDEMESWRVMNDQLIPFLDRHISWRIAANLIDADAVDDGLFSDDLTALFSSREYENLLINKLFVENSILGYYEEPEALIENILQMIEDELD